MRLSHKDFDLLQRTLLELYAYRDLSEFRRDTPGFFLKLVPADHFGATTYGVNPSTGAVKLVDVLESEPRLKRSVIPYWEKHLLEHPFTKYFLAGGRVTALMFSDFFTSTQLRNSQYWELVCKVLEYDRVISLPLESPGGISATGLGRRGRHFTERDRLILNLLRPHFNRAQKNAQMATERGGIAHRPLSEYGLLPREIEVAHWVAQGKTNPEIAMILAISPRTVEKHMERILTKLGVENRAAAAVEVARAQPLISSSHAAFSPRL